MTDKTIDLDMPVYEICKVHPEMKDIMVQLGFSEITKPGRLQTMGRMVTLRKGSKIRGVPLETIVPALQRAGFKIKGYQNPLGKRETAVEPDHDADPADSYVSADITGAPISVDLTTPEERQQRLEQLVRRLSSGENLETVRKEFVRDFASVSAEEIASAEQNLITGGMSVREVQRLCDVHSALFHGRTEAECSVTSGERDGLPAGHPVSALRLENDALSDLLDGLETLLADAKDAAGKERIVDCDDKKPQVAHTEEVMAHATGAEEVKTHAAGADEAEAEHAYKSALAHTHPDEIHELLARLKELKRHYNKKEELLMPLLYAYGITGPSDVMWGVDDEIYHELSTLAKVDVAELLPAYRERLFALGARMREMIYKEEQILFPLCLEHLTRDEWYAVYRDLDEFGWAFGVQAPRWLDGDVWVGLQKKSAAYRPADGAASVSNGASDSALGGASGAVQKDDSTENQVGAQGVSPLAAQQDAPANGKVYLPTGELTVSQLEAILKLLPVDLTFINETNTTQFFTNEGKVFARPLSCLGREVWSCHPPHIVPMVKAMIADFKSRKRDHLERWIPRPGNPVRVLYVPVWGEDEKYLGTLEIVQQFGELLPHLMKSAK